MTRLTSRMSDVAKLAGVSTMTVSRALNGNVKVSHDLRDRVLAAVKTLNYQPNELARSLREMRSRQIGVIVPYLYDPFFAICSHAVSEVAKKYGYSVVLSTSNEDPHVEYEEVRHMMRRNVEGMIVFPAASAPRESDSLLLRPEFQQVALTVVDRPADGGLFDSVLVDNVGGAKRGTQHLLSLGHKAIGFLGVAQHLYTLEMRYEGYCSAMRDAGLKPVRARLSGLPDDATATLRQLLARKHPLTAMLCGNNLLTRSLLHGLKTLGLSPPRPLALVGFDDFETADLMSPAVTVIRQPVQEMGRCAAETLFARLHGSQERVAHHVVLPTELVVRGSCGADTGAVPAGQ